MDNPNICKVEGCGKKRVAGGFCHPHYKASFALGTCSVDGCGGYVVAKGMCGKHYRRMKVHGDVSDIDRRIKPPVPCAVDGCENSTHWTVGGRMGWCSKHYMRFYKYGSTDFLKTAADGDGEKWIKENASYNKEDCLIWPFAESAGGYAGKAKVDGFSDYSYRHMCRLKNGNPPTSKHQAAHSCGNGHLGCVNPTHLRWATNRENAQDRIIHGTSNRGEKSPTSVLTEDQVKWIRSNKGKKSCNELSRTLGVARSTITGIWRRERWAWI